jgi:hypothetical protein
MPCVFLTSAGRGKRAVFWTVLCFAVSQLALWVYLDCRQPEVRDPLYTHRLHSLQSRLARSPDAPLVLLLGSSRVKYGLWPAAMPVRSPAGSPPPVIYNFAFNGAGFIRQLMYFRRLVAEGVRPNCVLVETWPPLWAESGYFAESKMVIHEDEPHWQDIPLLCRYFFFREPTVGLEVTRKCLAPIRAYRGRLLQAAAQSLLSREQLRARAKNGVDWVPADDTGWFPLTWGPTTPEQKRQSLEEAMVHVKPLMDSLCIDPRSDAALRELLGECQSRGIRVALVLMPEHGVTRRWYPPQARALIQSYLDRISRAFRVPIVDGREWSADEHFADLCHLGRHGVEPLSARVGREVVQPLLDGEPLSGHILLADGPPTP